MFATPVLLLVFNRLDTTKRVLTALKQIKPKQLFVAADGPRSQRQGENVVCREVRELVEANIDWPCEVHKLYREDNLGCGLAVSSAIDWFFSIVDKGIILEDDTLPDSSFFSYCEELLNYYEINDEVMHISGSNLQCGIERSRCSYYFSKYPLIWGWATWKNSWAKYSYNIYDSDSEILTNLKSNLDKEDADFFYDHIKKVKYGETDTWDFQWLYSLIKNKGLSVVPKYNLVHNVGFDKSATHTTNAPPWYKYLVTKSLNKIKFNFDIRPNNNADKFYTALTKEKYTLSFEYIKFIHKLKKYVKRYTS